MLLLLATACGSARTPVTAEEFTDRAREVAGHWRDSAERGPWKAGFVPLRNLTLEPDWEHTPRRVGRSAVNSAWKLETELPAEAPAPAELRWAGGGTLSVPVLTAAAAYAGLSKPKSFADEKCPAEGCRPLRVIAVARGEATVPSSRGGRAGADVRLHRGGRAGAVPAGGGGPGRDERTAPAAGRRNPGGEHLRGPHTDRAPAELPAPKASSGMSSSKQPSSHSLLSNPSSRRTLSHITVSGPRPAAVE
ncbi:hypothetical protein GCM10010140_61530 [Streptosporangium pseudovulgare]|uniref:Uncharacterized protein n=2 Tax=Streptosporangium pseudovulgare TaxID=35765 RepID=A0ABQ2REP7_9ACTN|nr:hypothetical protein GCM10010140_61530 [Streptosporangium pseudovulgare]